MKKTMKQAATSMKAIGYARVSTLEQVNEGVSLDAQVARMQAYATLRGLDLVEVVREEGVSGGTPFASRPQGARVLEAVHARTVNAVIVVKLDRGFRDAADCLTVTADWDARNVSLHICDMGGSAIDTASASGRFMLTVLAGAAEMEKNLIGERTSAALQHLAGQGVKLGGPALGWTRTEDVDADGRRVVTTVAEEADTVQRILALRAEGRTLRSIGAALETEGRKTKKGGRWQAETIRLILARTA